MVKIIVGTIATFWILHQAFIIGVLVQPGAPFWLSGHAGQSVSGGLPTESTPADIDTTLPPLPPNQLTPGSVSDVERYQLALAAGWSGDGAIKITAISFAENGAGNPRATNFNPGPPPTTDLGILQINSTHWGECGGKEALIIPLNNFRCGYQIYGRQGWCAWSTYGPGCPYHKCGPPCYLDFLDRARRAATTPLPPNQA